MAHTCPTLWYGVGGNILSAIKSMHEESMVCLRIGGKLGKKFELDVGQHRDCVMPHWLFNIFIDGVEKC
jgi:hypothetical protein